jgi:2-keto-4-pentenoate hydratase/2-oxohepta-3-ene-1,7-dioic acid hydratase in catechol pathway
MPGSRKLRAIDGRREGVRMRLGTYVSDDGDRPCAILDDEIVDLVEAAAQLPRSVSGILSAGALDAAAAAVDRATTRRALSDVRLTAPVRPSKFFGVGLNYADHAAEVNREPTKFPTVFAKMVSCVNGPYDPIERPRVSEQLDYEGELGIVIGTRCRHVMREHAPGVIAGYLISNDVTVRDWQRLTQQWTLGKSFDTHGPLGPWLVTSDELGDPHVLDFRTYVNGEIRQQSNTSNLIHDCYDLVAAISTACTLEPGDVIASGTSSGVATARKPPAWLVPGDVVRIEIDGIGHIENEVVQEPAARSAAGAAVSVGA